jgi:L-ascorbate metabolism protein UlaG (beta-lactamase superfamily)
MLTRLIRSTLAAAAVALLAACAQRPTVPADAAKVEVQWLGQAAVRIATPGGKVIVIDPWLVTNPKTPADYKKLEALGKVDLILVTHAHFDHMADAPALAKLNNAPVYAPPGLADSMATLGILPVELAPRFNKGGTVLPPGLPGVKVIGTHAEHSSEFRWKNPATGLEEMRVGGEPMGFIVELENGFRIYHMGDTGAFGDMKFIGEYYKPDLILIPIGNHFVMSPQDAAHVTREWLQPRVAIPIHYGTNPMLRGTPAEYVEAMGRGKTEVRVLQPGDKTTF